MMNYKKGKNIEEELTKDAIPIENLPQDFLWMHVSINLFLNLILRFFTHVKTSDV